MEGEFDRWNVIKKVIEAGGDKAVLFPHEGEVWMCSVGRNIGYEQNGMGAGFARPALIVKKFNNKMFWVVPLSSKQKALDFYHNFTDATGHGASAILAQLRLLSVKRFDRNMYTIDPGEFDTIKEKLMHLFR